MIIQTDDIVKFGLIVRVDVCVNAQWKCIICISFQFIHNIYNIYDVCVLTYSDSETVWIF